MKKICVLVAILVAIPLMAQAQTPPPPKPPTAPGAPPPPPPPPPGTGKWWKNSATVRELGLSETQVAQLEDVYLQHQSRLAGFRSALLAEEEKLKSLLVAERLDEKAVLAETQAVNNARAALQAENTEMTLGMRRLMSGDQWAKLEKIRDAKVMLPVPPVPPVPPLPPVPPAKRVIYDMSTPGIQEPELIYRPTAPFTAAAKAAGIEGIVMMAAIFESDGSISDVKVLRGLDPGLDEAAVKTVKTWKFLPAKLDGQPVTVKANVEMSFRVAK
jgi:TonB family protein